MEADQTPIDTEAHETSFRERIEALPRNLLLAILAFLVIFLCLIFAAVYSQTQSRHLKPERPSPTPNQIIIDGQPMVVSFAELNNNATAYQNKWIQITGNYFPKNPPICNPLPSNGSQFKSVLVSDGLQLNVLGGEKALAIIAVNTEMVVQGIWRLYSGPVGCGKEPASDLVWYLDIRTIVQPNPVVGSTRPPIEAPLLGTILAPNSTPVVDESIPTPSHTPIPVTVVIETPIATNTATPDGLIPTPTTLVIPTATIGTFTRTPTPIATATFPSQATATVTVTGTPPTAAPTNTPLSSIPTATRSSGYPGGTPTVTVTPGGYP